ncbi:MAG: hypothetical protein JEY96_00850 [Bacteroidales bacterium]|nr:hypothetical protein [Bacteroidales bacterium]
MKDKKRKKRKCNFHKWIQTIAAIIAIFGGAAGIYTLFMNDKDINTQLEQLTKLAIESEKQTKQLERQSLHLDTNNAILMSEFKNEISKWKTQLRPLLNLSLDKLEKNVNIYMDAAIINYGKPATIIKIEKQKRNNIRIHELKSKMIIGENQSVFLSFQQNNEKPILDIVIYFVDLEGNRYYQRFFSDIQGNIDFTLPKLIE